jgi:predicted HD phosphohydrolase
MTGSLGVPFADLIDLVEFMRALGTTPSGERDGMSALDHGLQCAYELSRVRPTDPELHVAGLVHDVGHEFGPDDQHGALGAECIRGLLGERVAGLVEAHVPAKRYLVASDVSYRSALSETSVRTLELQGGPLTPAEIRDFEHGPYFSDAVLLRQADDAAKIPGRNVPDLDDWLAALGLAAG